MSKSNDAAPAPTVDTGLALRLVELSAVTPILGELPGCEIRGHVAGIRSTCMTKCCGKRTMRNSYFSLCSSASEA